MYLTAFCSWKYHLQKWGEQIEAKWKKKSSERDEWGSYQLFRRPSMMGLEIRIPFFSDEKIYHFLIPRNLNYWTERTKRMKFLLILLILLYFWKFSTIIIKDLYANKVNCVKQIEIQKYGKINKKYPGALLHV